ncbi:hypothetical protein E1295_26170 [Nonomuraea mesophila]|uniref:Uncharacterized protein n=1 Tax=Nonomuraea mesophila TaxID=2530382 RepID=A0A4R5F6C0_9ACTN|nr:hypothetical protein [Nonomuraea mesophila]TDE43394.1 hypothetical protein E1295_26170 [Nonomuraea mesophila]
MPTNRPTEPTQPPTSDGAGGEQSPGPGTPPRSEPGTDRPTADEPTDEPTDRPTGQPTDEQPTRE